MPEFDLPESAVEVDAALDRLTTAVDQVLDQYQALSARSAELETEFASLRDAVGGSSGVDSADVAQLAAENKALREILVEARERAKRIRSQLAVVEDEV